MGADQTSVVQSVMNTFQAGPGTISAGSGSTGGNVFGIDYDAAWSVYTDPWIGYTSDWK